MKKNIMITILTILLLISCGYIAYDKISLSSKEEPKQEDSINQPQEDNNEKENLYSLDLSKLDEYKNHDNSYGTLKNHHVIGQNETYGISLSLDGIVEISKNGENKKITNLKNVVDLIEMNTSEFDEVFTKYYFLLENGDVYYYTINDYNQNKFTADKVNTVSNIKRIINFSRCPKANAGCGWGIIAITKDNEYIKIDEESV